MSCSCAAILPCCGSDTADQLAWPAKNSASVVRQIFDISAYLAETGDTVVTVLPPMADPALPVSLGNPAIDVFGQITVLVAGGGGGFTYGVRVDVVMASGALISTIINQPISLDETDATVVPPSPVVGALDFSNPRQSIATGS